jgi:hypothetical protein
VFHVVTVHWKRDVWIEPQLRYLRRYLPVDTAIYACLNDIASPLASEYAFSADLPGRHPDKLNRLAEIVSERAAPDDFIVFIDGDAFPIAPVTPEVLGGTPLCAVRRDENLGDPQPHPCFCVTTVGFWNEIGGDWRPGYTWRNELGYHTSDVGGNLLGTLRERGITWRPLLRSNQGKPHSMWYAIYGDVVYHHGAGFRTRMVRATLDLRRAYVPSWMPLVRRMDKRLALRSAFRKRYAAPDEIAAQKELSDEILAAIQADEDFVAKYLS